MKITSYNLLSYTSQCWHSYSPPQWCWLYYGVTPTRRTSVPHVISPPRRAFEACCHPQMHLCTGAFYLQKHIVIFLLSLAVRNWPSFFMSLVFSPYCWFCSNWPKYFNSLPSSAQMFQSEWELWAAIHSLPQNCYPALSRSQKFQFIFPYFFFFSFNKQFLHPWKCIAYEPLPMRIMKILKMKAERNDFVLSFLRILCSPSAGTGCWEIPWLHSRDYRGFHISDLPQHDS